MAKRTATQRHIDSINRNLQSVASTFGKYSQQYEKATQDIFQFEVYTNKNGIIQIKNNKANRAKHQQIRARRARNTNIQRAKKKSEKRMQKYNENKRTKHKVQSIVEFERLQKELEDKTAQIYEFEAIAQEYDIDFSAYEAFKNPDYLNDKLQQMYDGQTDDTEHDEKYIVDYNDDGKAVLIDKNTGEVIYEYTDI